ncbi:MAG: DUF4271 domain-containing protein [Bacteroidetes bacterium]|nr:DUF4271 domain-containing protein [Bacteroidota bacterium]
MNTDASYIFLQDTVVPPDTTFYFLGPDSLLHYRDSVIIDMAEEDLLTNFISEDAANAPLPTTIPTTVNIDWITGLILLAFTLLALIRLLFNKSLPKLFKAFRTRNYANQIIRDGNPFRKQANLLAVLIYFLSFPLLLYFTINYYTPSNIPIPEGINLFGLLVSFSAIYWLLKVLILKIIGHFFNTQKASFEVLINIFIFNLVASIIILPFLTLYLYTQEDLFLFMSIVILLISYLQRLLRELIIGFSYTIFSVLHLFLYLCTLEIIPIVIIAKVVMNFYMC